MYANVGFYSTILILVQTIELFNWDGGQPPKDCKRINVGYNKSNVYCTYVVQFDLYVKALKLSLRAHHL